MKSIQQQQELETTGNFLQILDYLPTFALKIFLYSGIKLPN